MSEETIDTSGLSCPQPLMMVKEALESKNEEFSAIIDTEVARENITRFLEDRGTEFDVEEREDKYIFKISG